MTEYLDKLNRATLLKLYTQLGAKDKGNHATQTKAVLVEWLIEEGVTKEQCEEVLASVTTEEKVETKSETTSNSSVVVNLNEIDPNKLKSAYANNDRNELLRFQNETKKKALEKVVITVTPRSQRDVEAGKTAESFFFSNQFFSVGRVVPFNVPCEVPTCIANVIKESVAPTYTEIPQNPNRIKGDIYIHATYRMTPKYNVVFHDKASLGNQSVVVAQ